MHEHQLIFIPVTNVCDGVIVVDHSLAPQKNSEISARVPYTD